MTTEEQFAFASFLVSQSSDPLFSYKSVASFSKVLNAQPSATSFRLVRDLDGPFVINRTPAFPPFG